MKSNGSSEYDNVIELLEKTNYAHQQQNNEEEADETRNDSKLQRLITKQKSNLSVNSISSPRKLGKVAEKNQEANQESDNNDA